jgi:hypothetical protein
LDPGAWIASLIAMRMMDKIILKTMYGLLVLGVAALAGCDEGPGATVEMATRLTLLAGQPGVMQDADGAGLSASFYSPTAVTGDGAGHLYVADYSTIRQITLATDAVTTLAGISGVVGASDGVGSAATFYAPQGIAYDSGNLYIADTFNSLIRKLVISSGEVTTFAGGGDSGSGSFDGIGTAAVFSAPTAIVADGAGSLFVTDAGLRQIDIATATVTTVAAPAAPFAIQAHASALDGKGNLYFTNSGDGTVSTVSLATGVITLLAGNANAPTSTTGYGSSDVDGIGAAAVFTSPRGLAYDGSGSLYVGDAGAIRQITIATGAVTTLLGTTGIVGLGTSTTVSTQGWSPALAFLGSELAVADSTNDVVLLASTR